MKSKVHIFKNIIIFMLVAISFYTYKHWPSASKKEEVISKKQAQPKDNKEVKVSNSPQIENKEKEQGSRNIAAVQPAWEREFLDRVMVNLPDHIESEVELVQEKEVTRNKRVFAVKIVRVKLTNPSANKHTSFNAMVVPETGEIIQTWNRTRHENFGRHHPNKVKLELPQ